MAKESKPRGPYKKKKKTKKEKERDEKIARAKKRARDRERYQRKKEEKEAAMVAAYYERHPQSRPTSQVNLANGPPTIPAQPGRPPVVPLVAPQPAITVHGGHSPHPPVVPLVAPQPAVAVHGGYSPHPYGGGWPPVVPLVAPQSQLNNHYGYSPLPFGGGWPPVVPLVAPQSQLNNHYGYSPLPFGGGWPPASQCCEPRLPLNNQSASGRGGTVGNNMATIVESKTTKTLPVLPSHRSRLPVNDTATTVESMTTKTVQELSERQRLVEKTKTVDVANDREKAVHSKLFEESETLQFGEKTGLLKTLGELKGLTVFVHSLLDSVDDLSIYLVGTHMELFGGGIRLPAVDLIWVRKPHLLDDCLTEIVDSDVQNENHPFATMGMEWYDVKTTLEEYQGRIKILRALKKLEDLPVNCDEKWRRSNSNFMLAPSVNAARTERVVRVIDTHGIFVDSKQLLGSLQSGVNRHLHPVFGVRLNGVFHQSGELPVASHTSTSKNQNAVRPEGKGGEKQGGILPRLSRIPRNSVSPMVGVAPSSKPAAAARSSLEFVETPMQMWGSSGPNYNGRDWGTSTPCDEEPLDTLLGSLNKTFEASGQASRSILGIEGEEPTSYFEDPAALRRSSDLGFELEVDIEEIEKESHTEAKASSPLLAAPETEHARRASVGATFFSEMNLNDAGSPSSLGMPSNMSPAKANRRKMRSFSKRRRMSLWPSAALDPVLRLPTARRHTMFSHKAVTKNSIPDVEAPSLSDPTSSFPMWGIEESTSPLSKPESIETSPVEVALGISKILVSIFMFLTEPELVQSTSAVSTEWADASTVACASLMLISVGCSELFDEGRKEDDSYAASSIVRSMERPLEFLTSKFPWAMFLSEGAFKSVYKVFNTSIQPYEAVSVMDVNEIDSLGQKQVVGAELAVSVMLSSLTRRNVCPNFVITRGVFTCPFAPPPNVWGCEKKRNPMGKTYVPGRALPKEPKKRGRYQYIRMKLCCKGDAENYIKELPYERMDTWEVKSILFQIAFALHAAGDWYSMKHYDLKLLNVFLQDANAGCADDAGSHTVLRYGLGRHVFAIRMPSEKALIAKLADYGTANIQAESEGQPIKISQITTPENTTPDFMILGDAATQGYGHDCFNLGLCLLHLSTGHKPYEEILEDVKCPPGLQEKLERIWEDEQSPGYEVIRSVILSDVDIDKGGAMEGEPDQVFYHTLYRFLVLFGIPEKKFKMKEHSKVWCAISSCLDSNKTSARPRRGRKNASRGVDADQFGRHRDEYSLERGTNKYIARARELLEGTDGGMELLLSLVDFDPQKRATALDVLNSKFMHDLLEEAGANTEYPGDTVYSYMAFHSALK